MRPARRAARRVHARAARAGATIDTMALLFLPLAAVSAGSPAPVLHSAAPCRLAAEIGERQPWAQNTNFRFSYMKECLIQQENDLNHCYPSKDALHSLKPSAPRATDFFVIDG
jgi:hypothetical protein